MFLGGGKARTLARYADTARDSRRWDEAAAAYRDYLKLKPNDGRYWVQYGHALKESGDIEKAEAAYHRAACLLSSSADVQLQLGHLYKLKSDLKKSAQHYRQAWALDPELTDAKRELEALGEPLYERVLAIEAVGPEVDRLDSQISAIRALHEPVIRSMNAFLANSASLQSIAHRTVTLTNQVNATSAKLETIEPQFPKFVAAVALGEQTAAQVKDLAAAQRSLAAQVEDLTSQLRGEAETSSLWRKGADSRLDEAAICRAELEQFRQETTQFLDEINKQKLVSFSHALDTLKSDIEVRLQQLEDLSAAVDASPTTAISEALAIAQQADHRTHATNEVLARHSEMLAYLVNRLEFIRREMMLEFRHGRDAVPAALKIETRVISQGKFDQHRDQPRLNLGCGHIPAEGYLNVDLRELPGVDIVAEADQLPFASGEVAEIRSAHMLEHFPQAMLERSLLPYWFDLLRPGGIFAAVVPDAAAMIAASARGEYAFEEFREVFFGGQDYAGDFHYNMFTPESLVEILTSAGFADVRIVESGRRNGACFEFEILATKA